MSQEELIRFKIKNKEYKLKLKSENEKFSSSNIHKIKFTSDLNAVMENSINNNKTPLFIRESS